MEDTTPETTGPRRVRQPPAPIMQGAMLCTVLQAAGLVARCERWVYEALADGRITGVKSDGRTLIVVASLHEYIASLPPVRVRAMSRRRVA
ncbi:MAG: hypothetical protein ACLQF1_20020 [Methyloceanibacter sp.]